MSNNDLISREYLRDAFDNLCCHNCKTCRNFRKEGCSFYRCDLIDNAPTVITCEVCKNKGNERECVDCHDYSCFVQYEPRPQGEWLWLCDAPNAKYKWSCNKCGRGVKEQENYCPKCGAKMKNLKRR